MNNWDQYRRNAHRAANGGNYRQHDAGKGDVDRSTHLDTYKLGAELIRIAADKGRDSKEYQETYLTPYHSASRSVVDAVIHPQDTRRRVIAALEILEGKASPPRQFRKHGNIPL